MIAHKQPSFEFVFLQLENISHHKLQDVQTEMG